MHSSLLETIDPLFVSNWPCCCCPTSSLHSFVTSPPRVPLCPSFAQHIFSFPKSHTTIYPPMIIKRRSVALISPQKISPFISHHLRELLINIHTRAAFTEKCLASRRAQNHCVSRPTSPKCLQKSNALSASCKRTSPNRHIWLWWNPAKFSWP